MYPWREYVEAGGLMAYACDHAKEGQRGADDVHEILIGAKPADISIYRAIKLQLIVNLNTAMLLGLTIPPALLARANEVIE
jgi:putative tryptophan/tyrosine transport system substrate-binding protein